MMLRKVFTKENISINAFMTLVVFVVYIVFLGYTFGQAFTYCLFFFGLLSVFDFVIVLFRNRA